jgi:hypothetical protein
MKNGFDPFQQQVQFEHMCKEAESTASRLGDLERLLSAKGNKLAMQIRVLYNAEGCEVDLLRVGTPPAKPVAENSPAEAAKPAR